MSIRFWNILKLEISFSMCAILLFNFLGLWYYSSKTENQSYLLIFTLKCGCAFTSLAFETKPDNFFIKDSS